VGSGVDNAKSLLRDSTPDDLSARNRSSLRDMGVQEATIDVFLASSALSPADKTIIVESLRQLGQARAREVYVAHASRAPDTEAAFFIRRRTEMIAAYHRRVEPVTSFIDLDAVAAMQTRSGKIVVLMPADYVAWTQGSAGALTAMAKAAPAGRLRPATELAVTGKVSSRAASELKRLGWQIRQNVRL